MAVPLGWHQVIDLQAPYRIGTVYGYGRFLALVGALMVW